MFLTADPANCNVQSLFPDDSEAHAGNFDLEEARQALISGSDWGDNADDASDTNPVPSASEHC